MQFWDLSTERKTMEISLNLYKTLVCFSWFIVFNCHIRKACEIYDDVSRDEGLKIYNKERGGGGSRKLLPWRASMDLIDGMASAQ